MTTSISFDGLSLTGAGSMVNFPNSMPVSLNTPSTVTNTPSRPTGIILIDSTNSVPFPGTYTMLTGGITEYNLIKAKESIIGILVNNSRTLNSVLLKSVSGPVERGGVITCALTFELIQV